MFNRLRQFREATSGPHEADIAFANELLPESLLPLFHAQEPRDVLHGVRTGRWLVRHGDTDRELLQAALLHDVGKGAQRRSDRVIYVLAEWLRAAALVASSASALELRKAAHRSLHHPEVGAAMLSAAGASPGVVSLTTLHHGNAHQDDMLARLIEADAAS